MSDPTYAADPRRPLTMRAAARRYRLRHPWLLLVPRRWWQLHWSFDGNQVEINNWRWKTRADRDLDRRMANCCCHPDQPRGHA